MSHIDYCIFLPAQSLQVYAYECHTLTVHCCGYVMLRSLMCCVVSINMLHSCLVWTQFSSTTGLSCIFMSGLTYYVCHQLRHSTCLYLGIHSLASVPGSHMRMTFDPERNADLTIICTLITRKEENPVNKTTYSLCLFTISIYPTCLLASFPDSPHVAY